MIIPATCYVKLMLMLNYQARFGTRSATTLGTTSVSNPLHYNGDVAPGPSQTFGSDPDTDLGGGGETIIPENV